MDFSVWAPSATTVAVLIDDVSLPMRATGEGWWSVAAADAGQGSDYRFVLDGGDPLPDPRSAWQPHGVHGPSRVFDEAAFTWTDHDWAMDVRGAVLYELHVGTFTAAGTFDAASERLGHLVDLGVQAVQLMPVAQFPGRWGWGYDGVDLYAVHHGYGGPRALQRFVDACHRHGMGVLLDVVYNHLGPSGNYLSRFGPYFTDAHHTPWGEAVNLDGPDSGPVRRFIIDNALRWLRDFHLDGLRLDAVHELRDDSPRHLLAQLSDETATLAEEVGRPLTLIAESDLNDDIVVTPTNRGGRGMQAQWADDVHHAVHACLTGERHGYYCDFGDLPTLAKALTRVFIHDGGWSTFRGREWGRPVDRQALGGHSFVVSTSTHDQVGNRAHGDRPGHRLSPARKAVAAALLLTGPFTPMLFMGEEFDASTPWQFFSDHLEPTLAQAILQGRRDEFASHGWPAEEIPDPGDPATRQQSVLNWDDLDEPARHAMLDWYRDLIRLRRTHPELLDDRLDDVTVDVDTRSETLVMSRGSLAVVISLAPGPRRVRLSRRPGHLLMAWPGAVLTKRSVFMPTEGVAIVRTDQTVTVRDAVSGYLRRIGGELQTAVDADDVHDMRVACRRIRSVLRAHEACWRGADRVRSVTIAEDARTVARALSDHRDSEVLGEVIDDWADADGWSAETREELLALLYPDGRTDGDDGTARDQARDDARRVAADLAVFLDEALWRGRSPRRAVGGLAGYRSRAATRVGARVHNAGAATPQDDPDGHWHLVRKASKRLRYTGEVGAAVDDPHADEVASAAKHVQTVIGDLQDARLMLDRLTAISSDSAALALARSRARRVIEQTSSDLTPALDRLWHSEPGLLEGRG